MTSLTSAQTQIEANPGELVVASDVEQPFHHAPRNDGLVYILLLLWLHHLPCSSRCALSAVHWFVSSGLRTRQAGVTLTGDDAGSGEAFNVGQFLEETSPYAWASTGIGLCLGLSVLGAGWYVCPSCRRRAANRPPLAGVSSSRGPQFWVEA